jgi:hypothetical protein
MDRCHGLLPLHFQFLTALEDDDMSTEIGKREIEREHLWLFLDAYQLATGETFSEMYDSETPDFIGRDEAGRTVGIEIAQLRFSPDERHMRRIEPPEPHDMDAWWRLLELMHDKDQKLNVAEYTTERPASLSRSPGRAIRRVESRYARRSPLAGAASRCRARP